MVYLQVIGGYTLFFITISLLYPGIKGKDSFLKIIYILLIIPSIILFVKFSLLQSFAVEVSNKCSYCSIYSKCFGQNNSPLLWKIGVEYFYLIFQYSVVTFAVFIIGTLIASLVSDSYQKIPMNLITAVSAGIFLPLCVCGVFPLVKGLMSTKKIKGYALLSFLFITPLLNPYTLFLSYSVMGTKYFSARLIGAIFVAVIGAFFISSLKEFKKVRSKALTKINQNTPDFFKPDKGRNAGTDKGISNKNHKIQYYINNGYLYFKSLSKPILIGIIIGSLFSTIIPPQFIDRYINNSLYGLFLTVLIAIPLHVCAGQEIILLKPLQVLGLSTGYQISFSIAAAGICLSVIPLFCKLFGKKLTGIIILYFFIASIGIGYLTNLIIASIPF